jgi:S-disulfanyl-L-cysteine oxidoreductase SoxD
MQTSKLKQGLPKQFKATAAILIGLAFGTFCWAFAAQQDTPATPRPRSVWDGVYTDEQAKRGESLYHLRCASCHGDKMTGGESAPPLAGGQFLSNWNGLTLDVLFERIRISMPSDNPAAVARPAKADILAYILSMNKFPAGKSELQYKAELMKDVMIEAGKPKSNSAETNSQ